MNIDLPNGWSEKGGRIKQDYDVAINENGVAVGYTYINSNSYSIWAGEDWDDNKTLDASCTSESEAKIKLLEFMSKYPKVRYESAERGIGTLYDENDSPVYRI